MEIYTEKDGGVIFRKYSPMGDLQEFASQMCEAIGANTGCIAAVSDRDSIIALHGAPKRELIDKPASPELEKLMELRKKMQIPGRHPGCKKCKNLGTENCRCKHKHQQLCPPILIHNAEDAKANGEPHHRYLSG